MTVNFKIDFNKFVKVKRLEKVDGISDDYSVYCCEKSKPDRIDKVYFDENALGNKVMITVPLSYYERVNADEQLNGKDFIEEFNGLVFIALPPKEALQCDYFWTLQKLPQILEKMEEIEK